MGQLSEREKELIGLIASECATPKDVTTKLKEMFAATLEQMLESEMDEHLGYMKHIPEGDLSGNSRNGYGKKTIKSEWGESEIFVPRDRNGSFDPFDPKAVEKRQTRTDDIENRIISMYAMGVSTRDIENQLREIYVIEASPALISSITDKVLPLAAEFQSRPLDEMYPVVFFDGIPTAGVQKYVLSEICCGLKEQGALPLWRLRRHSP